MTRRLRSGLGMPRAKASPAGCLVVLPIVVSALVLMFASRAPGLPLDDQCRMNDQAEFAVLDPTADSHFGGTVAIEGNVVFVGASDDDVAGSGSGAVYVYSLDGGLLQEEAVIVGAEVEAGSRFGIDVAISGDVALVGSYWDDDMGIRAGAAYVFRFDGNEWMQEAKLFAADPYPFDEFGNAVAIDGNVAVVGSSRDDDACPGELNCNSGSTYVFRFDGIGWIQEAKLTASDGADDNRFGGVVAVSGDLVMVASMFDDDACPWNPNCDSGSVYAYGFDGSNWLEQAKLTASDAGSGDRFGTGLVVAGDVAFLGAPGDNEAGSLAGAFYIFSFDGAVWIEETKVTASDATGGESFGSALALSGERLVVGAYTDDDACPEDPDCRSGSAYVFRYDGVAWAEDVKLAASDAFEDDRFGLAVSIRSDAVIVGAIHDNDACVDDPECRAGSVYLFTGFLEDCNGNDAIDTRDVFVGTSQDCQGDGTPDDCQLVDNDTLPPGGDGVPDECNCTENSACDDGDLCTGVEFCDLQTLLCVPGVGVEVDDDEVDCTIDGCDPVTGLVFHLPDNAYCDNGYVCWTDTCDPELGCVADYDAANGLICGEGDSQCQNGACVDCPPEGCSCTVDAHCDDGNPCKGVESCDDGAALCQPGTPIDLDDGVACTQDTCDPETGVVSHDPLDALCDDGDYCTVDACDAISGCSHDTAPAEGGPCFIDDAPGVCQNAACVELCVLDQPLELTAAEPGAYDQFGTSVAISGDVALIGASTNDEFGMGAGAAHVYRFDGSVWVEEVKLTASDAASGESFGRSVSLDGDVALVGAWNADNSGALNDDGPGAAYVYRYDSSEWVEEVKLVASDGESADRFGTSVALAEDLAVVGASGEGSILPPPSGNAIGAAYVYRFDGSQWTEEAKLTSSDGEPGDRFGASVATDGELIVVGDPHHDALGQSSGSVYVFAFDGSGWVEDAILRTSDADVKDHFGSEVDVSGEIIAVGAYGDDDACADAAWYCNSGAIYMFRYDGVGSVEETKLIRIHAAEDDLFGDSISIEGDLVAIGARHDDDACPGDPDCQSGYAPECSAGDFDIDGDVDFADFGGFQVAFTGD